MSAATMKVHEIVILTTIEPTVAFERDLQRAVADAAKNAPVDGARAFGVFRTGRVFDLDFRPQAIKERYPDE